MRKGGQERFKHKKTKSEFIAEGFMLFTLLEMRGLAMSFLKREMKSKQ